MTYAKAVGILGLGLFLPPQVRRNDDWPPEVVAEWGRKQPSAAEPTDTAEPEDAPGVALVKKHLAALGEPAFEGITERRVVTPGMTASDMELHAASDAIRAAGIDAGDIGAVFCDSAVPDQLVSNNACLLHHRLGLAASCSSMSVDAACNAFLLSLSVAVPLVASGAVRYALLVQSSSISRLLDYTRRGSQFWGDCATAAVIGPVSAEHGIIGRVAQRTDGRLNAAIAAGIPGKAWYENSRVHLYSPNPGIGRRFVFATLDLMKEVADAVFRESEYRPSDVDFFNTHQAFCWMRPAMQEFLGFARARSVDTFPWSGNCFGATMPLGLAIAARDGLVQSGQLVFLGGLGAGATASAALIRWGS